jgi:t-SNARE complex subunit (syntaxin)
LVDRIATHEGDKALKEITDDLKRAEQAKPHPEPQNSSYDIDEMLHEKQHELREISTQLDVARVDVATATIQLESAVKQRGMCV